MAYLLLAIFCTYFPLLVWLPHQLLYFHSDTVPCHWTTITNSPIWVQNHRRTGMEEIPAQTDDEWLLCLYSHAINLFPCLCFISFCGQMARHHLLFYVSCLEKEKTAKNPMESKWGRVIIVIRRKCIARRKLALHKRKEKVRERGNNLWHTCHKASSFPSSLPLASTGSWEAKRVEHKKHHFLLPSVISAH